MFCFEIKAVEVNEVTEDDEGDYDEVEETEEENEPLAPINENTALEHEYEDEMDALPAPNETTNYQSEYLVDSNTNDEIRKCFIRFWQKFSVCDEKSKLNFNPSFRACMYRDS